MHTKDFLELQMNNQRPQNSLTLSVVKSQRKRLEIDTWVLLPIPSEINISPVYAISKSQVQSSKVETSENTRAYLSIYEQGKIQKKTVPVSDI